MPTGGVLAGRAVCDPNLGRRDRRHGSADCAAGSDPRSRVRRLPGYSGCDNWWATSYHPGTQLFYLLAHESCMTYTKNDRGWQRGRSWLGARPALRTFREPKVHSSYRHSDRTYRLELCPDRESADLFRRPVDRRDVVFFGEDSGAFAALDAHTGEPLWHFQANQDWKASPMTYMVGGRQYVAIASDWDSGRSRSRSRPEYAAPEAYGPATSGMRPQKCSTKMSRRRRTVVICSRLRYPSVPQPRSGPRALRTEAKSIGSILRSRYGFMSS